jgi:para-nitrobenzyl esterase
MPNRLDRRRLLVRSAMTGTALLLPRPNAWSATPSEPVVETTSGQIRGVTVDSIATFKGIPYGASTAGANRFMPPQKPAPWGGGA